MKETILIIVLCSSVFILYMIKNDNGIYIKSMLDNREYYVSNYNDKEDAANMISRIRLNLEKLSKYIYEKKDKYPKYSNYIERIYNRIYDVNYSENNPINDSTSYSVNKGDELVFCIRSKYNGYSIHNLNDLMYVAIHELAHIGCPEEHHTKLFFRINKFLIRRAIEAGIYTFKDYEVNPVEYCGISLNASVLK